MLLNDNSVEIRILIKIFFLFLEKETKNLKETCLPAGRDAISTLCKNAKTIGQMSSGHLGQLVGR